MVSRIRLMDFTDIFQEEIVNFGAEVSRETMHEFLEGVKQAVPRIIDANRVTPKGVASPVGYVQGKLGRSVRYRTRQWKVKNGYTIRGYLWVGEGLEYAHVHDRDGYTVITPKRAKRLKFYDHREKMFRRAYVVSRPGSPYLQDAISYSLAKLDL